MLTNGYSGYFAPNGFQNKADALKYAMELSFRLDEKGLYYLDKEYALNIYHFIIENVELPNTKNENITDFLKIAEEVIKNIKPSTKNKKS